jgi:anti-anti-sigma regulatory factor
VIEIREEGTSASGSAVVVRCAESGGAAGVMRCVDLALRLGQLRLVVDLGARDGADADLLSVLHRSGERMRDAGGRLAVVCSDSRLRRLFEVTLLSQGFSVYATHEEALAG